MPHALRTLMPIPMPAAATSDDRLVHAWTARDDRDALAALLAPALAPGWRLAASVCGPDVAADAVQEACLRAVALRGRFRPGARFLPWFLALVRAQALHQARAAARRRARLGGAMPPEPPAPEPAPEPEAAALLPAALAALRAEHRQAVWLRHGEGLDFPAIATALACRERTARTWVARGLAALERWFSERGLRVGGPGLGALIAADGIRPPAPAGLAERCGEAVRNAPATAAGSAAGTFAAVLAAAGLVAVATWLAGGGDPGPGATPPADDAGIRVVLRDDGPDRALAAIAAAMPGGLRWIRPTGTGAVAISKPISLVADPWARDRLLDRIAASQDCGWTVVDGEVRFTDGAVAGWVRRYADVLAAPGTAALAALPPIPEPVPVMGPAPAGRHPMQAAITDPALAAAWVAALADPDRAPLALRHLRHGAVPAAAPVLRRMVANPWADPETRRAAIEALRRIDDAMDLGLWSRLETDPSAAAPVRAAALVAALALPSAATRCRAVLTAQDRAVPARLLAEPGVWPELAAIAIARDPDPGRVADLVIGSTGAARAALLQAAADAGISAEDPRLPSWWRNLDSPAEPAWAATQGGPELVSGLVWSTSDAENPWSRTFIGRRLAENRRPGVPEALVSIARTSTTAPRTAALVALGRHRDPRALGMFLPLLGNLDGDEGSAAEGLLIDDPRRPVDPAGWDGDHLLAAIRWHWPMSRPLADAIVTRSLREPVPGRRRQWVSLAGTIPAAERSAAWQAALPVWLADPDPGVRGYAGSARLIDPRDHGRYAAELLPGMLADPAPFVRAMGAFLAGTGVEVVPGTEETLARLARSDAHPQVRMRAAFALTGIRPDVMEYLLDDPDPGVRAQAVRSLGFHRQDPARIHPLLQSLRDREPDAAVRAVIDDALEVPIDRLEILSPAWIDDAPGGLHQPTPEEVLRGRG